MICKVGKQSIDNQELTRYVPIPNGELAMKRMVLGSDPHSERKLASSLTLSKSLNLFAP